MTLAKIAETLGLRVITQANSDIEIKTGYASDLLSDVLAKASKDTLLITNQKHQNVIGVAVMLDLAGIIIAGGIEPDENTVEKSIEEHIPLYTTDASMFEIVGKLYDMGIRSA